MADDCLALTAHVAAYSPQKVADVNSADGVRVALEEQPDFGVREIQKANVAHSRFELAHRDQSRSQRVNSRQLAAEADDAARPVPRKLTSHVENETFDTHDISQVRGTL